MDGVVSVYNQDVRFFCIDEEVLQDKFDLLFATARLMGYKICSHISYSLRNLECSVYSVTCSNEDKLFSIVFDLLSGAATAVEVTMDCVLTAFEVDYMDNFLNKLDELLAYI